MFKKTFKVHTQSAVAMDLVKVLGKYGIRFEVSDEYFDEPDPNRAWYRDFTIHATPRMMRRIQKEFEENTRVFQ